MMVRRFLLREAGVVVLHGCGLRAGGRGILARLVRRGGRDPGSRSRAAARGAGATRGRLTAGGRVSSSPGSIRVHDRTARDRPTPASRPSIRGNCTRRSPQPSARTTCGTIVSAGRCTRPMPASTRSFRSWLRFPRPRPMWRPRLRSATSSRVPITARGGGTSQAGQSIGPGVILDCSKHFDRVLEINADERWVRVEPGCVLDDLNRALKPHRLLFAPDVSTSNRATIGGMIANNSCGAQVGALRQDDRSCARAEDRAVRWQPRPPGAADRGPSSRPNAPRRTWKAPATARPGAWLPSMPRRSIAAFPRSCGGWADTTSMSLFPSARRAEAGSGFNLARLLVGSEGTLGVTVEAKLALVELPRARATLVVEFAGSARRPGGNAAHSATWSGGR